MLCFDVKIDKEAQQYADEAGVKIFSAEIIYHLFDNFSAHQKVFFLTLPPTIYEADDLCYRQCSSSNARRLLLRLSSHAFSTLSPSS
jgi:hypothetical protein